jgi:methylenetetrahydrofolate dehydrogenase (NADP+)/methenyltetrahydrofolate cyclohydrolase
MAEARLIDGKAVAALRTEQVRDAVQMLLARHEVTPGLATILVGDDPASRVYVRSKARACAAAGIASFEHTLPSDAEPANLLKLIDALNHDDRVDGILVQLPLPRRLDAAAVIAALDPGKDVDGFHPLNIGELWSGGQSLVPCTPQGCVILLHSLGQDLAGAHAVVLGRSQIVGRPLAALLLAADCTVTLVHSKTRDPAAIARSADILIAAMGKPDQVKADWIKPGALVIDVGVNRVTAPDGSAHLVGDVDFAAARRIASAITPVPGGVGPMTIACLLRNTVLAACRRRGLPDPLPAP